MTGRPRRDAARGDSPARLTSHRSRAQTTQDFAVGIGIFLLAIAFVFAFIPTVLTPFSAGVGGAETAQADRVAGTIVDNLSTDASQPNHVNATAFDQNYSDNDSEELAGALGLRTTQDDRAFDHVNVTVRSLDGDHQIHLNGSGALAGGDDYDDGTAAASASRIVGVHGDVETESDDAACESACQLLVRVW